MYTSGQLDLSFYMQIYFIWIQLAIHQRPQDLAAGSLLKLDNTVKNNSIVNAQLTKNEIFYKTGRTSSFFSSLLICTTNFAILTNKYFPSANEGFIKCLRHWCTMTQQQTIHCTHPPSLRLLSLLPYLIAPSLGLACSTKPVLFQE